MPYRVNLPPQIKPVASSPYLQSPVRPVRNGENGASGPEKLGAGTSEADRIVKAWRTLGTPLNPNKVKRHLAALTKWQSEWHDNS